MHISSPHMTDAAGVHHSIDAPPGVPIQTTMRWFWAHGRGERLTTMAYRHLARFQCAIVAEARDAAYGARYDACIKMIDDELHRRREETFNHLDLSGDIDRQLAMGLNLSPIEMAKLRPHIQDARNKVLAKFTAPSSSSS